MSEPVEIHVVSDATGETATRVVMAVERQFPDLQFEVVRHPPVRSVDDVQLAATRARGRRRAVMVYTLVEPAYREAMRAVCKRYRLHYVDVLRGSLEAVERVSGIHVRGEPGARPRLDSVYFRRMAAIEFAVQADDGVGARRLQEADVVLVGVSRTSKTPLSIYLGYLGWKAANVPIVKGIEPPRELWEVPSARVIGLTIEAERLLEIREGRAAHLPGARRDYAELNEIYVELEYAEQIHRRLGCPVIEVSALAIVETDYRIGRLFVLGLA
jgi:regulator of PEP synthase PpsR (kinase-PPPase family)